MLCSASNSVDGCCCRQMLKMKSKELERSRSRLQQQNCRLQQQLMALQLHDSSLAPSSSPSTDTGQYVMSASWQLFLLHVVTGAVQRRVLQPSRLPCLLALDCVRNGMQAEQ